MLSLGYTFPDLSANEQPEDYPCAILSQKYDLVKDYCVHNYLQVK